MTTRFSYLGALTVITDLLTSPVKTKAEQIHKSDVLPRTPSDKKPTHKALVTGLFAVPVDLPDVV